MLFKTRRRAIITLTIALMILLYFTRSFSVLIPFSITIIALLLFLYIDNSFKFNFPERFYVYIFLMFIFGLIVGPGNPPFGLYYREIFFDKFLHFISPIMISAIVFFILNKLKITLKWKLLMTVGLVFGILGLFEIGEYLSDVWFDTLHQGVYLKDFISQLKVETLTDPLDDTMQDLIYGLMGSVTFVAFYSLKTYYLNRKKP